MKCLSNLMIDNIDSIDNIDMYIQLMFVICVMLWLFLGNQTSFLRKALGFIVSKVIFYFLYFISLLADVLHKWVFCCLLIYFAYLKILVDGPILVCLSTLLIWKYWWMAQISVDGPSVHLKFLQRVQIIGKWESSLCLLTLVAVDYTPFMVHLKLVCRALIGC